MSIYIRSEFLDREEGVYIETRHDKEPKDCTDIIGIDFKPFPYDMHEDVRWCISYELFQAYQKQKKADKEYAKYHYEIEIDVEFAKQYLYKNLIEQYAIIDRLVEVLVKDNEIKIKYDMDNEIKETTFEGGFDLLREWKLKDYK